MSYHVAMPFQVNGGPELDGDLETVRQAIAAQEGISGANVQRDAQSDTMTVEFDVASDDHKAVMRSAIRVVKSAVVSTESDAAWRNWNHDGPTRITAN
jgi:hypothetical protein